jgi:amino acid transporter
LSRIYKSSNNGGAYIFVRGTFGKFLGIIVAFMLYICMPFMIAYQIMLLIRGAFAPQFVGASVW